MTVNPEPLSRPWWNYVRFSRRALIVFVLLIGAGLGCLVRSAHVQRDVVAAIWRAGGSVFYDSEWNNGKSVPGGKPWAPRRLTDLIGVDYFGRVKSLLPELDERRRRQWAAAEARELGWGGVSLVAHATGLSRPTIMVGLRELDQPIPQRAAQAERVRRPGGGRRPLSQTTPALLPALEALVEPVTPGDPESPLRWTCKSTRRLAEELTRQGYRVGTDCSLASARGRI